MHQKESTIKKAAVAANDKTGKIASTGNSCPPEEAREGEGNDETMAIRVIAKKAAAKKAAAKKAPKAPKASVASKGLSSKAAKAAKRPPFNAETMRVLRDADAGKNLTRHADTDDLFKKLGIKLG